MGSPLLKLDPNSHVQCKTGDFAAIFFLSYKLTEVMYMELMVGSHLRHVDDCPTWHFVWTIIMSEISPPTSEFEPHNMSVLK